MGGRLYRMETEHCPRASNPVHETGPATCYRVGRILFVPARAGMSNVFQDTSRGNQYIIPGHIEIAGQRAQRRCSIGWIQDYAARMKLPVERCTEELWVGKE